MTFQKKNTMKKYDIKHFFGVLLKI